MTRWRKSILIAMPLLLAGGVWLLLNAPEPFPVSKPPPALAPNAAASPPEAAPPVRAVASKALPPVDCGRATVVVTPAEGPPFRECVEAVSAVQNGSVRSYVFRGHNEKDWTLKIDGAGTRVLRVETSGGKQPQRICTESACNGVNFGRADINGVQTITLAATRLQSSADASDKAMATIDAELTTAASAMTCAGEGITMNFNDSTYTQFCALGGTGFEIRDDGTRNYTFTSLDGDTLVVTPKDNTVVRVELAGSGMSCENDGCYGATISAADAVGVRTVGLIGTSLQKVGDGGAVERSMTLNGWLKIPPLEEP